MSERTPPADRELNRPDGRGRHGRAHELSHHRQVRRRRPRREHGLHRHRRRLGLGIVIMVLVAVLGPGLIAFASFVSSSSTTVSIGAGEVDVEWNSSGGASLAVPIGPILPGQSVQRLADLRNTGSLSLADLQLVVSAPNSNDSDGVQLAISRCSVPWSGTASFTCSGVESTVSPDRPLRAVIALPSLGTKQAGGSDHLRLTFRLPTSAPSALQTTSTTATFEILGNQGAGRQQ